MSTVVIYGSYGYTGSLIAREAVERGLRPVLAGRDADAVRAQADELDLRGRAFDVTEATDHIRDADAVLNCAGPFSATAVDLAEACLETGTHYLDITGEIGTFQKLHRRDDDAEDAGVTLLPGVGFDVVPTDCLAAHLAEQMPSAKRLRLGFDAEGSFSPGTLKTGVEQLGRGGVVRQAGTLKSVSAGWKSRTIDFGRGRKRSVTVPWGDVATAYYSTGIPNVEVYLALPRSARLLFRGERYFESLLSTATVQSGLKWLVDRTVSGPDERERERGFVWVWGEAVDGRDSVVSRLRTPHTYEFTARAAVEIGRRVADGEAPTGYQTPSSAFGAELVLDVDGVQGFKDES